MKFSIQEIICILIIIISIITSVISVLNSKDIDNAVNPILSGIATIITFFIMMIYYKDINELTNNILGNLLKENSRYNGVIHIATIIILFIAIKFLVELILKILQSFSLNNTINKLKHKKIILFIFSVIFGAIKGVVIIITICIPIVLYNNVVSSENKFTYLDDLIIYDKLNKMINSQTVLSIKNGVMEVIKDGTSVYYNGITVEEGIKSNDQIKNKAIELTKNSTNDLEKAKIIYNWITRNIKYDDEKAAKISDNPYSLESGAIPTFRDKKGICFDYSCLYTAMLKDIGIKSKIIIGEGYNGEEFIGHAWNKVYIKEQDLWIKVDTTFGCTGNYFNNADFDLEHKESKEIGEF
ncbi:MAG: transglutaminase domain-containing protein [Clostridiales bacterium]|nr:transglutaminase domain-containing protein [Clostridiales bacterium]